MKPCFGDKERVFAMISWKNLDTLAAWKKLAAMKDKVNVDIGIEIIGEVEDI